MPHVKGTVKCKNGILIQLMSKLLPNGEHGWQAVSTAYQEASKEEKAHDTDNLKRPWTTFM
jgi:hypothetical protein